MIVTKSDKNAQSSGYVKREFVVNKLKLTIFDMKRAINETQILKLKIDCAHTTTEEGKIIHLSPLIVYE